MAKEIVKTKNGFVCGTSEIEVWVPVDSYSRLVNEDSGYKQELYDFDVDSCEEAIEMACIEAATPYERKLPDCIKCKLTVPMLTHANVDIAAVNSLVVNLHDVVKDLDRDVQLRIATEVDSFYRETFNTSLLDEVKEDGNTKKL